ncbi:hypothetical protein C4A74_03978 [Escherichia coli]|nr:hypothetical protein C4A74_03978 [Escherichia coli]RDQ10600.1 hypothetical protein C4A37_03671 [Escherichia coli]
MSVDSEKATGKKSEPGWLAEYFAEIFLFILNCILWGYLWFETPLLQSYY